MHLMRTLQARIVVTTVTLLAVVCAVLGVGAAVALRHYLSEQLAQEARVEALLQDRAEDRPGRDADGDEQHGDEAEHGDDQTGLQSPGAAAAPRGGGGRSGCHCGALIM